MPTDKESFLKGIRTYCERNGVSQYDAVLCEKAAEYSDLYALDPEAFERGFMKVAQYYEEPQQQGRAKTMWQKAKPWVIGGAATLGALGLGSMYGRHAQRTGNPYGPIKGSLVDFAEWLTGKQFRYHPLSENG